MAGVSETRSEIETELSRRIEQIIDEAEEKVRAQQAEASREFRELRERHEKFLGFARKLIADAGYPLDTLARHFENAKVVRSSDLEGFHAICEFQHTQRFPASVELRFDISHDEEIRKVIVSKTVSILPVFMEFERHDSHTLDLEDGDREATVAWIRDEVVSFVQTYLRIPFVDQYQSASLVTDPVAKVRFAKHLAAGEASFRSQTYHFLSDETRREFEKDPKRYVAR